VAVRAAQPEDGPAWLRAELSHRRGARLRPAGARGRYIGRRNL